jgi:glutamate-1-semialdehyde 2,1-aminomutase
MVTFGKYLGGGMPFGAFGGRKEVMAVYDPRNPASLAHSGTFQNNTMMLIAGHAGLSSVYTPELAVTFNKQGDLLRQRLNQVFKGTVFTVTGVGSLMCIHATTTGLGPEQIRCKDDWDAVEASSLKVLFWLEMLEAGFWFHRRGSIALNIELPTEALDAFINAAKGFIERHRDLVLVPDESWAR